MLSEQEFRTFLGLASIPLREMRDGFPVGISSGCLIDYRGNHWLLAVEHSTGDMGHWAVEVGFERGRGTQLYQIGPMNFVARGNLSGVLQDLDMAYARVPVDLQPR